jgi:hypothetical protein
MGVMADNTTKANLIAKILFIAGGIILFVVLVIFIFRMVPYAVSNIASMGSKITSSIKKTVSDEEIQITTDTDTVDIENPVIFSFEYDPQETVGQYYVSYDCIDGLFFDIQSKDGPKRIICETPLKLGTNLSSISLTPIFTDSNTFADSVVLIEYKDTKGNVVASGSKTITVKGKEGLASKESNPFDANGSLSGSSVTTQPLTPSKTTATPTYTSTYIKPTRDLVLTQASSISTDSTFVIYVYNYGNTSTGPWEFSYTDAENPSRTVMSPIQASLGAGQGLAVTVRFDGQDNSRQTIAIVVDPSNKISETNESNNSGSTVITGDSSNSNDNDDDYNSRDDADLSITNMEVGRISGNRFDEDDEIEDNDTAAVRFVVKNQGGESTGSWRFEIDNLPYDNDDTYRSKSYSSLRPGESLEVVVEFEDVDEGRYSMRVEVDSDDDVDEERENNNTESETLEVNN